ncbi:MAG: SDR family oxidoreductase [Pseudomonadales bacterium]
MSKAATAESVTEGVDLSGKLMLVTGVNSGLGQETMRVLCLRGAHVIGAARTLEKAEAACAQIDGETTALACELSDLESVATAAKRVAAQHSTLDAVICNAGIMALPELKQAHELEMQFLCNHVGHFLLLRILQPLIERAEQGRVVLVSSDGHRHTVKGGVNFDNLDGAQAYDGWRFYGQSKLANILTAKALAEQFAGSAATANAVHPGVIRTNLSRNMKGLFSRVIGLFAPLFEKTIAEGAATQVYLAANPDAAQHNGCYFSDVATKTPSKYGQDTSMQRKLWQVSNELIEHYL